MISATEPPILANHMLRIRLGAQTFLAHHTHVAQVLPIARLRDMHDERGQPMQQIRLAELLQHTPAPAHHALLIATRRRTVALLVTAVDLWDLPSDISPVVQPLPPVLRHALTHAWITGILIADGQPLQLLNLRQIAQDALKQAAQGEREQRGQPINRSDEPVSRN